MPPLDSGPRSPRRPPTGRPPRENRWDWLPPDQLAPPDVGEPVGPAVSAPTRLKWTVEPVPAWPPAPVERRAAEMPGASAPTPPRAARPLGRGARPLHGPGPDGGRPAEAAAPAAKPRIPPSGVPVEPPRAVAPATLTGRDELRGDGPDVGPSRLVYRLNRLWLTPGVKPFVRMGLPALAFLLAVIIWASDEARRQNVAATLEGWRVAVETQPMFMVNEVRVLSRSPEVAAGVENLMAVQVPVSSWHLDLQHLRDTAEALDAVETASVRVSQGVLEVRLTERVPAMVWRHDYGLDLVDARGFRVARLTARSARADLPLIAGAGAPQAIAEARALLAAAQPWADRIRGLVRVGERRWDLVLHGDQRVMLPAQGALSALERVIALGSFQQLLQRDVSVIDMRLPTRPTLRLPPETAQALAQDRRQLIGEGS